MKKIVYSAKRFVTIWFAAVSAMMIALIAAEN